MAWGAWIFLNVVVALAPLGVIALALHDNGSFTPRALMGDGFLFYFSVTLAAGLVANVAVAGLARPPRVGPELTLAIILGGLVFIAAILLAYYRTLRNRHAQKQAGAEGGEQAQTGYLSGVLALCAIIFTLWIRWSFNLW